MNKDVKSVAISFTLVVGVALGSSVLYSKGAFAEQLTTKRDDEYLERELIGQQAMRLLLIEKTLEAQEQETELTENNDSSGETLVAVLPTESTPEPVSDQSPVATTQPAIVSSQNTVTTKTQTDTAALEAQKQAQIKAQEEALAQQVADAKAVAAKQAAAQLAAQKAAAEAAAKAAAEAAAKAAAEAARQSSAS